MGLRNAIDAFNLYRKGRKAADVIGRESVNYDFRISLAKGLGRLILGAILVSVPLFVEYLGNETVVGTTLVAAGLSPEVASIIAVFLAAVARVASNYTKNK